MKASGKHIHKAYIKLIGRLKGRLVTTERSASIIHQMRLCLKEIKSLFAFVKFLDKKFKAKKNYAPLKNLFVQLGETRNLQIYQKMIEGKSVPATKKGLQTLKEKADKSLVALEKTIRTLNWNTIDSIEKKLQKSLKKKSTGHINNELYTYLKKLTKELYKYAKDDYIYSEESHHVKKLIKKIRHQLTLIKKCREEIIDPSIASKLKKTEQYFGKWHDKRMATHYLYLQTKKRIGTETYSTKKLDKFYSDEKSELNKANKMFQQFCPLDIIETLRPIEKNLLD